MDFETAIDYILEKYSLRVFDNPHGYKPHSKIFPKGTNETTADELWAIPHPQRHPLEFEATIISIAEEELETIKRLTTA